MASQRKRELSDSEVARLIKMKAYKLHKRPEYRGEGLADIEQDLHLKWLETKVRYDPTRGSNLAFADIALNNHIRNMIASRRAQKRNVLRCAHSLDAPVDNADELGMTGHEIYDQDGYFAATGMNRPQGWVEELRIDLGRVLQRLPTHERELTLRLLTHTLSDVAQAMKIPRTTLYGWLEHIRGVFTELGLDEYL
jgi:DNA-directed RNA polymerase specialized sigma24 family protein